MFTDPYNSPGRWGVNLQEKDELLHPNWATQADGLILNNTNQLRSIGGLTTVSSNDAASAIRRMFVYKDADGDETIIHSQDTRIVQGTATNLQDAGNDITSTTTPTNGYWQFVNFNGKVLGFQAGEAPIVKTTGDFADIVVSAGTLPDGDVAVAAYGRVWAVDDDRNTIRYSALLDETDYSTASGGGSIDMRNVWTLGIDFVTGLAAFNGSLIVFGREHIVIYTDAQGSDVGVNPDNLAVADVIAGTGCVARDSIQLIGDGDILFLSRHGVQSLGRLLIQKDNPLTTISWQIRDTLSSLIVSELGGQAAAKNDARAFNSMYIPEQGQYILMYSGSNPQIFFFHLNARTQDDRGREVIPITIGDDSLAFSPTSGCVAGDGTVYVTFTTLEIDTYDLDKPTDDGGNALDAYYESGWILEQNPETAGRLKILNAIELIVKNPAGRSAAHTIEFTNDYDTTLDSIAGVAKSSAIITEIFDSMGETEGRVFKFGLTCTDFGQRVIQSLSPSYNLGKPAQLHENADNYTSADDLEDAGVSTIPFLADFTGSPLTQPMLDCLPTYDGVGVSSVDVAITGVPDLSDIDGFVAAVVQTGSVIASSTMAVKVGSSGSLGSLIRCSGDSNGFTYGWVGYIPLDGVSASDLASGSITLTLGGSVASTFGCTLKLYPVKNGGTGIQSNSDEWGAVAAQLLSSDAVLDDPSITTSRANSQVVCAVTTGAGLTATDDTLLESNDDLTNFTLRDHLGGFANSGLSQMFLYFAPCVPTNSTVVAPNVTFSLRNGTFGATRASIDAFEVPA